MFNTERQNANENVIRSLKEEIQRHENKIEELVAIAKVGEEKKKEEEEEQQKKKEEEEKKKKEEEEKKKKEDEEKRKLAGTSDFQLDSLFMKIHK